MENKVMLLRSLKGLSQKAVAAELGISQGRYNKLERNYRTARLETIERLAGALVTTVAFLTSSKKLIDDNQTD